MENSSDTLADAQAARDWVPVEACTLPTAERPVRVREFDDLFAAALRDVQHACDVKVRLVLSGDETLPARVQQLVDAETSCCSFFRFILTRLDHEASSAAETVVALDIEVPAARVDVLAALVSRAQARQVAS